MKEEINWLEGIKFDNKNGEITFGGERHTIVHSAAFKSYRDAISEIIGHGADAVLYLAGKRHTENFVKIMVEKSILAGFVKRFGWGKNKIAGKIADIMNQYGFGDASIEKLDLEGESVIIIRNSCIATSYKKKQKKPVCSYISGLIAGAAVTISGKHNYECVETHCKARGDKYCRFVLVVDK
jgi:predicted hydrocarbon binding protein